MAKQDDGTKCNGNTERCPECGTEYNSTAEACPQCGCPNDNKPHATKDELAGIHEKEREERYHTAPPSVKSANAGIPKGREFTSNANYFSPRAESVLHTFGLVILILGFVTLAFSVIGAIIYSFEHPNKHNLDEIVSIRILQGVLVLLVSSVIWAFINVRINISVTLQEINRKIKE